MKLVLDEHYSPSIAVRLRERGYDVVAVGESGELRELPDEPLLRRAQQEGRVVVTENVRDFTVLHHAFLSRGEMHAGIVFTSPRKFPRRMAAVGRLITALAELIEDQSDADSLAGQIAWL